MSVTRGRSRTDPNEDSASSSPRTGSAHSTQSGGGPSISVKKTKQRKFIFKQYGDFIVHSSSTDNSTKNHSIFFFFRSPAHRHTTHIVASFCVAINIYQLENPDDRGDDSTGSEPERTGKPIPGNSAFRRPNLGSDVQLRLINSWHLEGVKKIKFNRGLVFCLTTQLEAWHLWVTRVSVRFSNPLRPQKFFRSRPTRLSCPWVDDVEIRILPNGRNLIGKYLIICQIVLFAPRSQKFHFRCRPGANLDSFRMNRLATTIFLQNDVIIKLKLNFPINFPTSGRN
jgi:hypothetical protein